MLHLAYTAVCKDLAPGKAKSDHVSNRNTLAHVIAFPGAGARSSQTAVLDKMSLPANFAVDSAVYMYTSTLQGKGILVTQTCLSNHELASCSCSAP